MGSLVWPLPPARHVLHGPTNKQTSTLANTLTRNGFFRHGLCLQHLMYYTDRQTNNHTSKHTNTLTRDGFFGRGLCLQHLVEQQFQHVREVGQLCAASRQLQGVHPQTAQTPHSLPQHSDHYCLLLSVRLTPVKAYTCCMHQLVLRYKALYHSTVIVTACDSQSD